MAVSINIGANANPMRPFPTLNPQPFFYPQPFHQPQFWPADHLYMVVAAWEAIFKLINPIFRFLCPCLAPLMAKPLENKGFGCPKNVQKK
jgi:hypothetical protein